MKIESLKPGMVVYDVGRRKMGHTTVSTVSVWRVRIVSVDLERQTVQASWNGNAVQSFREASIRKWRKSAPLLIRTGLGAQRLATRAEIAAAKAAAPAPNAQG